jgi:hypothetical protein
MPPRRVLEEVDCNPIALHDCIVADGRLRGNSKSKPVFIKGEGRFQVYGREFRCDTQKTRHGKDLSVYEIVSGGQLITVFVQ